MLTSSRGIFTAIPLALIALTAAPVSAQGEIGDNPPVTVSANVTLASEYRFRGVDLSGGDIAVQGGFDIGHASGVYAGTWASSLDEDTVGYGSTETDVYAGWSGAIADGLTANAGVIGYFYPDAPSGAQDYFEFYGSLGTTLGPAEAVFGAAYAPDQGALGDQDNIYVYGDLGVGVPGTPVTVKGHLGYTDGFLTFTDDGNAIDWSLGAQAAIPSTPLTFGVSYVGVEGNIPAGQYDFADDAVFVTLGASF